MKKLGAGNRIIKMILMRLLSGDKKQGVLATAKGHNIHKYTSAQYLR